jgi:hypothetical protein
MSYLIVIILLTIFSALVLTIDIVLMRRNRKIDGEIVITVNADGRKLISLEIDKNPDDFIVGDYILFKVTDEPTEDT